MRLIRLSARGAALVIPAVAVLLLTSSPASANVAVTRVSTDPYTNTAAQHRTEVEPDTFAFGNTIVSAFQVGRFTSTSGATNIGFATSTDGGSTWINGFLPGTTASATPAGPWQRVSDPVVAFDARHNVWLISLLGLNGPGTNPVLTSVSTDGGRSWSNPVITASGDLDKNWIVCDNTSSSPFFGTCYTEFDIVSGNQVRMTRSTDGGRTWGSSLAPSSGATGLGGQPVVRPNGTVIVPYWDTGSTQIRSFRSIDGGVSWRATVLVASISHHTVAGGLREGPIPSAEIDSAGTVYVAWADCRFRSGCPSNDIVISKSTSETTWASPVRVPIDGTGSTVDHFVPGLGVDPSTSGTGARIGLTYYFYPTASCSSTTCQLDVGFISSTNGGSTWTAPTQIAGPMSLSWLPSTSQGRMFGDYVSTSVRPGGRAFPVIPIAFAPSNGLFDCGMYVPTGGLSIGGAATLQATMWTGPEPVGPPLATPVSRR
jgi:hypothetical protein